MIRHISLFTLHSEKDLPAIEAALTKAGKIITNALSYEVHINCAQKAEVPGVVFSDVVQIIDFKTPKEACSYPAGAAHQELMKQTAALIKQVTCMDFVLTEEG